MMIQRLAVLGVGLIGGSLALALKAAQQVGNVVGAGRSEDNLKLAQALGVVDEWTTDLSEAVTDADVVVLAVPMGAYAKVMKAIAPALKQGAIVTDAGSTKAHALDCAKKYLPEHVAFVAAHPLAGTEKSGADAAFATLYQKHLCIITPDATSKPQALALVQAMWQAVGCQVLRMPADEHDELLAAVSHLPHVAAFAVVNAVRKQADDAHDPFAYAAGGFRDFTRIASSSPLMWRDIAMANREALIQQIDGLSQELMLVKAALLTEDETTLFHMFSSAKHARDLWLQTKGEEA